MSGSPDDPGKVVRPSFQVVQGGAIIVLSEWAVVGSWRFGAGRPSTKRGGSKGLKPRNLLAHSLHAATLRTKLSTRCWATHQLHPELDEGEALNPMNPNLGRQKSRVVKDRSPWMSLGPAFAWRIRSGMRLRKSPLRKAPRLGHLVATIDGQRQNINSSLEVRLFILDYYRTMAADVPGVHSHPKQRRE
jgi:hypothetical protein